MKLILSLLFVFFTYQVYGQQYNYKIVMDVPQDWLGGKIDLIIPKDNPAEILKKVGTLIKYNKIIFEGKFDRPCYAAQLGLLLKSKRYVLHFVVDSGINILKLSLIPGRLNIKNSSVKLSESNLIKNKLDSVFYKTQESFQDRQLSLDFHNSLFNSSVEFLKSYPQNFFSLTSLYFISLMGSSPSRDSLILGTLDVFSKPLQLSPLGMQLRREKNASIEAFYAVRPGHKVDRFIVQKVDGGNFSNYELNGKPYIIAFSATWCHPCQIELPKLIDLYNKYKAKGLKIIYFNLDDNIERWIKHIRKNNLTWINVSEKTKFRDSKIAKRFHIYGIPNMLLVNKEGEIVYNSDQNDVNTDVLEEYIRKILN